MTAVGSHTQIIGAIVNVMADDAILDEKGRVDVVNLKSFIYYGRQSTGMSAIVFYKNTFHVTNSGTRSC